MSRTLSVRGFIAATLVGTMPFTGAAIRGHQQAAGTATRPTVAQLEQIDRVRARLAADAREWQNESALRFENDRRIFFEKRAAARQAENLRTLEKIAQIRLGR